MKNVISENQSDRILEYANAVLHCQESEDGRGGVDYYYPKFNLVHQLFQKGSRILMIGCGNGEEVQQAIDLGYDAVGVTLNLDNIDYAKEEYGIDLIRADMHSIPLDTETFDGIASFQTFEHSYSPLFFLLECNRLLKVGGRLLVEAPSPSAGLIFEARMYHIMCCTIDQLRALLMQSNFKDIQVGNSISGLNIFGTDTTGPILGTGIKKNKDEALKYLKDILYV
jgi:SAM-dependent methyltransferase